MAGLLAVSLWLDDDHGGYSELPLAEPLTVTAGADLQRVLDLQLQRPSLRVRQPDGSPAVGVRLLFQNAARCSAVAAATDAEGRTQAPRLSAGTFAVRAQRDDVTLAAFRKLHGSDSGKEIEFAVTIPADAPGTLDIRLPATWEY